MIRRRLIRNPAQVADSYLVALAHHHHGNLATFDEPLARAFASEAGLVALVR